MIGGLTSKALTWACGGLSIALLLVGAWALRVDHLRAGYKDTLDVIVRTVERLGGKKKLTYAKVTAEILTIHADGEQYKRERDNARETVTVQSESIIRLKDESEQARAKAKHLQQLVARLTADRDVWIQRAQEASTRLERLTAEQEAKECDDVLNSIREASF